MWNNILPGWRVARYSLPVSDAKKRERKKEVEKKVKEKKSCLAGVVARYCLNFTDALARRYCG
jgi:hypothetical protein